MRIRSDYSLRLLLNKSIDLGLSTHVRNLVEDVLRHMGDRSPYRGGKVLTDLLRQAHAAARMEEDEDTAERLEDALSYAMNVMLSPDLEVKYQLLGNARRRNGQFIGSIATQAAAFVATEARSFVAEHSQVSVDELLAHLDSLQGLVVRMQPEAPGVYEALRGTRERVAWIDEVFRDRLQVTDADTAVPGDDPHIGTASAVELADAVLLRARRSALDDLAAVVLNRHSSERDLQSAIEANLWIFGGRQLSGLGPRRISLGIELDLTLLRPDGTVHVVELKRACVPVLTHQRRRNVPTNDVHRAVTQAMNYLVVLDEDRARLAGLGLDVRRASATVIIGHASFERGAGEAEIDEALRVYNRQPPVASGGGDLQTGS
ncbi:Shedu anti-phage system protein SduA domain-containing protein [Actinoplanes sp. NPDC051859]|uniref:Shedu anti-phage system protein SduA domain-containing protein n=1 Tax=Actinoplanes sp. NPDC051859 TaxID=3363909 RepID=UPI0037A8AB41